MDTSTIVWIIVAVVVVLLVLALLASVLGKRRKEQARLRAEELRREAVGRAPVVQDAQLQAQQAEAEAQRKRAEAERAEAEAAEARQGADVEHARHEDQIRTADRIDPDVDHKADDYAPRPVGEPGHEGQPPVGEANQAPGREATPPTGGATPVRSDQPPVDPDYDTRVPDDPQEEPPASPTHRA
jgi:hypothetical protein